MDGWAINVKGTHWLYREDGLMGRERRRNKLPVPERKPLLRPLQPDSNRAFRTALNGGRRVAKVCPQDCGHTLAWTRQTVERVCSKGKRDFSLAFKTWLIEQATRPGVSTSALSLECGVNAIQI